MLRDQIHAAVVLFGVLLLSTLGVGCTQPSELSQREKDAAAAEGSTGDAEVASAAIDPVAQGEAGTDEAADAADAADAEDGAGEESIDAELPEMGSALKRDKDGNVIPDGPPPVPNDDPSRVYGKVPEDWIQMPGQATWIDMKNGSVIIDGVICRKTGLLELLVCTGGFKLHESVIAAHTKPSVVMAALLAVKAIPGGPAEFEPEFKPAHGTQIDMTVRWMEGDEEVVVPAQDLIIDRNTQDVVDLPWVLAGSGMWKGVDGGPERFASDHTGDFVCVSNFASCMMDLPAQLTDSNEMLSFTPNTELVPPLGTKVRMVFTPRIVKEKPKAAGPAGK